MPSRSRSRGNLPTLQATGLPPGSGVYALHCLQNGRVYVGRSVNVRERVRNHLWNLRRGSHCNQHLQAAFTKYGEDGFVADLIMQCPSDVLSHAEGYFIRLLCADTQGFNLDTADELGIRRASPETKARMSASQLGRRHSPETRLQMSASQMGRKHSGQSIEKMRVVKLGKTPTTEARARMSDARKAKAAPVNYNGEVSSVPGLALRFGLSRQALKRRLLAGWSLETALTTPVEPRKKRNAISSFE